jgi:C-terminal processing protease CtpA/Prc
VLVTGAGAAFARLALLTGRSTVGAPEVLAACLKKGGARIFGERTPGLGVERQRFNLKQGGAVELVARRWVGLGGEKLDRQGVIPDQVLRLTDADDPLAKALAALAAPVPDAKSAALAPDEKAGPKAGHAPAAPKTPLN